MQGQGVSSGNVRINSSGDVSFDIMPTGDTTYGFRLSDSTLVVNQTSGTVVIDNSGGQTFEKIQLPPSAADGSISLDLSGVTELNIEGAYGDEIPGHPGEYIDHPAITNGSKLGSVTLPDTPFTIKKYAFQSCTNLTNVDLSRCTSIGEGAFDKCSSLTSVDLSSCTSIGDGAFGQSGLSGSLDLSNCTSIGQWTFKHCHGITSVILSSSCIEIGWSTFEDCTGLTSIDLSGCTTIGEWAFRMCVGLTDVNLSNCTEIKQFAFELCSDLTNVIFSNDTNVIIAENVFKDDNNAIFNFPCNPTNFTYPNGSVFPNGASGLWNDGVMNIYSYTWDGSTGTWSN